jgi:hypothetical protein
MVWVAPGAVQNTGESFWEWNASGSTLFAISEGGKAENE